MFVNLKALIVVLGLAWVVFALAKPAFLRFTLPEDFARRRTVWFLLTIVAFLSPNFWFYALFALPLIAWAAHKDSTPTALYLLLFFVIPPVSIPIPTVLINQLFGMSNQRILAFAILLPAVIKRISSVQRGEEVRLNGLDVVLLLYCLLQLVLLIPYETSTNTLRRAFLSLLDGFLTYFAFSRLVTERRQLVDTMGGLCLSAAISALIGIFESLRGWLLYTGVPEAWGQPNMFAWLFRSEALRAQAATGHSITLGYILAMAVGFWMYLRETQPSKASNVAFFSLMSLGLFFTYARGPWAAAALVAVLAIVLGSRNAGQMIKILFVPTAVSLVLLLSPWGSKLIDLLPFVGSAGIETVTQRQALAETSWRLVQQNPWFGNPFVLLDMEDLRTGDHIIDLVNAYAQVALFYGLVGLGLFMLVYVGAIYKAYVTFRNSRLVGDMEMVWLGASLIACMIASLFLMATSGHLYLEWASSGLLVGYAGLEVGRRSIPATAVVPRNPFRPRPAATP